jgi:hypothetical protein
LADERIIEEGTHMVKLQLEGQDSHVHPLLFDLQQHPNIEWLGNEERVDDGSEQVEVRVVCYVKHRPQGRLKIVHIETEDGVEIRIPIMDLIQVEMEDGTTLLAGRSFDIFG